MAPQQWYAERLEFSERRVGPMCTFGTTSWGKRHAMTGHPVDHGRVSTSKYKTKARYTLEFRQQIVDRVRAGRPVAELVQQFGCTAATIRNWLRLARKQDARPLSAELTIGERAELERLRRENRRLLLEREFLSRAVAWCAQETHPNSKRSSDS